MFQNMARMISPPIDFKRKLEAKKKRKIKQTSKDEIYNEMVEHDLS